MLVNDWLHEWDIGESKALIEHLIRILYACKGGADLIDELNQRCAPLVMVLTSQCVMPDKLFISFRGIPPFGGDTVRVFRRNMSELKGFAARDYEDVLQVRTTQFINSES